MVTPASMLDFLLVEDNEDHAMLVRSTLRAERIANELRVFGDAESALEFLRAESSPIPRVVLVDINLPGMDGLQFVKLLKDDDKLRALPTVVLSTSDAEVDRRRAYAHGANSYLAKPLEFEKFRAMIKDLGLYWGVWNVPANP